MLIAENKLTHQRYFPYKEKNILEIDDNKNNIICPFCKENVKDKIIPTHFQPVQKWVEEKDIPIFTDRDEWIANGCQTIYDTVGGYYKTLKTEKNFVFDDEIVTFDEFYILLTENTWKNNNFLIAKLNDLRFWK